MRTDDEAIIGVSALKRLADTGGVALQLGMADEAEVVFIGMVPYCPPISVGPLIGLAMARYAKGNAAEGIEILQQMALPMDPSCPDTRAHLALILSAEGRADEAAENVRLARQQPLEESTEELIRKVENGRFSALSR